MSHVSATEYTTGSHVFYLVRVTNIGQNDAPEGVACLDACLTQRPPHCPIQTQVADV